MRLAWEWLDRQARSGNHAVMARLLLQASEEERLALARAVEAGIKGADPDLWWRSGTNPAPGYALAVIGTAPSAAKAATLLMRRELRARWRMIPVDRFLAIALARELDWLGDLGTRLSRRLPTRNNWNSGEWVFTTSVMRAGGVEPPVTEGIVHGWLLSLLRSYGDRGQKRPPLNERMRDDPYLDLLLPAVFEFDGFGADIAHSSWGEPDGPDAAHHFHSAVVSLVAEGRLERKEILAAVVDRLVRGDKPNALRPFVLLHDELAPTVDEIAGHALDYARMLAEGAGPVATLSQRALRTLDDAGRLDLETLLDAGATALLRREKTLVKAQISWLEKVARREPGRAGEVFETIAVAFGHPALDIQERALTLIGRQVPRLGPELLARLADAAQVLAGDLPARAAELFGGAAPVAGSTGVPSLPPPAEPAPMPPPIATAAELAEEVVALLHEQSGVRWERVLAALVTLHAADGRGALATALRPVMERYPGWFSESRWNSGSPFVCLATAIRMVIDAPRHDSTHQRLHSAVRVAWQEGRRGGVNSKLSDRPDGVLALRAAEVAVHLNGSMMPMLIATPTRVNGSLDPAVLLERLSRAEAEGWQPWPFDLEQALLRLPRTPVPAEVTAGAAALTSAAGRQFAQWLASGGLPDPVSEPFTQFGDRKANGSYTWDAPVPRRLAARLRPSRDGGLRLERQLLTLDPFKYPVYMPDDFKGAEEVLAMVLPHHREVAAAWALGEVASMADQDQKGTGRLLPLLADGTGPIGPAMVTTLAYTFGAKQEPDRAAAVDAFLTLAAAVGAPGAAGSGATFAGSVGAVLGDLCSDGTVKLSRVIPGLADAHRAGASVAVWELLTAALPELLAAKPRSLPDLLELATQVAVAIGARGEIPGLAAEAARPGSSRLAQETKRLRSLLTP
ncbi:hypothetical protein GCM10010112_21620 [Actinoplanes lobatus]|uniref:Secreted protein n=1 Tax=Actinoplanes lobatus TaxID=113568 RepID=A0A7W7HPN2_9ACTN|nr:DUF6493 family protein [Actinoplanes lobatus]MBB4754416.1 hypothetical protein [Actinoplanes lobatus]GGN62912.1 hypothetical protein GCM10010112_21620 [Actinoplanes lobatus]GIE40504.1 hypothetical protein Alo02nite_34020 [Actinoplanes lobatus]